MPLTDRPAIAVLAFVNMSGDPEQEHFSDGITEDIITALSKLRWFFVIARNSSFIYKGQTVPLKQIAEELGVGYVLEGSVRKAGERVRITVQLNDVTTGSHLWGERYDRDLADVFAVQDEITDAIVAAIEPQLYAAEEFRSRRKPPQSLDAWNLVMRGLSDFWCMTRIRQSRGAGAAQTSHRDRSELRPGPRRPCGQPHVRRSDGLGSQPRASCRSPSATHWRRSGRMRTIPGRTLRWRWCIRMRGSIEDTLAEYELALRLNPNFALAQACYALVLTWVGRVREGAAAAGRAIRLSPRDPFSAIYYGVASYAAYVGRDYGESIRLGRESIRQRNDFVGGPSCDYRRGRHDRRCGPREIHAEGVSAPASQCFAGPGPKLASRPGSGEREHFMEGLRRAGLE